MLWVQLLVMAWKWSPAERMVKTAHRRASKPTEKRLITADRLLLDTSSTAGPTPYNLTHPSGQIS